MVLRTRLLSPGSGCAQRTALFPQARRHHGRGPPHTTCMAATYAPRSRSRPLRPSWRGTRCGLARSAVEMPVERVVLPHAIAPTPMASANRSSMNAPTATWAKQSWLVPSSQGRPPASVLRAARLSVAAFAAGRGSASNGRGSAPLPPPSLDPSTPTLSLPSLSPRVSTKPLERAPAAFSASAPAAFPAPMGAPVAG